MKTVQCNVPVSDVIQSLNSEIGLLIRLAIDNLSEYRKHGQISDKARFFAYRNGAKALCLILRGSVD